MLREAHEVDVYDRISWSEDDLIESASGADVLLSMLSDPITERVLETLPELLIVAQYAVGTDNIDLEAAAARDVAVTHTPGVLTDATADMTFALLLAAARKVREADGNQFTPHLFQHFENRGIVGPCLILLIKGFPEIPDSH